MALNTSRTHLAARQLLLCMAALACLCPARLQAAPANSDAQTTRIVSFVPSVTETLFAIGAGDMVVGDSEFCRFPEAAQKLPKVGGLLNPNTEKIISLRPTIVLLSNSQQELSRKLSSLGLASLTLASDSLEDVYGFIRTSGQVAGKQESAKELDAKIRSGLEALKKRYAGQPRVRALIIVGRQPATLQGIYAAGPHTYLGQILEVVGGENGLAAKNVSPYTPLSKEQILAMNPSVILDASLGEAGRDPRVVEAHKKVWQQLPMLDAVRTNRIHYLADPHLTIPGPAILDTAQKMGELLHGEKK